MGTENKELCCGAVWSNVQVGFVQDVCVCAMTGGVVVSGQGMRNGSTVVWPLVSCPCSSGWPHTQAHMRSTVRDLWVTERSAV